VAFWGPHLRKQLPPVLLLRLQRHRLHPQHRLASLRCQLHLLQADGDHRDARDADGRIARLQAVRVADVQRVLQQHVLAARRVTVEYTQGPAA